AATNKNAKIPVKKSTTTRGCMKLLPSGHWWRSRDRRHTYELRLLTTPTKIVHATNTPSQDLWLYSPGGPYVNGTLRNFGQLFVGGDFLTKSVLQQSRGIGVTQALSESPSGAVTRYFVMLDPLSRGN